MLVSLSEYHLLSTTPGIYLFLDKKGKILYVGKAKNLKKRVSSYFLKSIDLGAKTSILVSQIAKIKTLTANSEIEAYLLESDYIKKYKPKYNIKLTDDKAYLMVKITIKDKYPKILIVRRQNDKNSVYFGPYPNSAEALRIVLKTIRKIFPYQSAPNHAKKICLYYHLGLCPCPPVFSAQGGPASGWDSEEFRKEYRKNIKHIINFLKGNTRKIIKDLKKERDILSKSEEFEKANLIQNKIIAIKLITDSNIDPLSSLQNILSQNGIYINRLKKIECYDISNTSGTNATGSLVVFVNGEKNSNLYRKFKIKTLNSPNDFGMMEEVLKRRLNHPEWPYPDLIIVDGGKGQVSAVLKVLRNVKLNIPLVGLAKSEEIIITSDFKEIILSKKSNALKLVMRIRDEAHRFAIAYHRKLRSKSLLFK